jgi:nickel/cobalt transporter (NicO) family protein
MTRTGLWFIVLTALCLFPAAAPGANPFLSPDSPRQEKRDTGFRPGGYLPEPVLQAGGRALAVIVTWQGMIRHKAADVAREIKQNPMGPAFWAYLGLAFAYGVIHALGPGHGKVFVGTYFLTRNATLGQGVLAGAFIGFLHVFSATILVLLFYFILGGGGPGGVDQAGKQLQTISAAMVFLVGLFLAGRSGMKICRGRGPGPEDDRPAGSEKSSLAALALAVGLVPCPGAAVLLFFSISLDLLVPGLLSMVFLALGLAVTTTAFGWAAFYTRRALAGKIPDRSPGRLYHLAGLAGGVFISLVGAALFFTP